MGCGPSLASCTWPCCHEAPFLGGVHLSQTSHPTMGTSWVGATLPDCTSVYHTQAGRERQGDRPPARQEREEEPLSLPCAWTWWEAKGTLQGPRPTPAWPTQPGLGVARLLGIRLSRRKVGPCTDTPPLSCEGMMEGHRHRASKQGQSLKWDVP